MISSCSFFFRARTLARGFAYQPAVALDVRQAVVDPVNGHLVVIAFFETFDKVIGVRRLCGRRYLF